MSEGVIWLRDVKSRKKWSMYRQKDITTVGTVRSACGRQQRYATEPGRESSGAFLKLTYKGKTLTDDSLLMSDIHYPLYEGHSLLSVLSDTIDVEPLGAKDYTVDCNGIPFKRSFHNGTTLGRLKAVITTHYLLPTAAISIDLPGPEQEGRTLLSSLASQCIRARIDGHCALNVSTPKNKIGVLIPLTCTVLDLISFLQVRMFRSGPAAIIHDLKLVAEGRELRDNEIIGEVFRAGTRRVGAVVGSAWAPGRSSCLFASALALLIMYRCIPVPRLLLCGR
jgi:hypothetical protein